MIFATQGWAYDRTLAPADDKARKSHDPVSDYHMLLIS